MNRANTIKVSLALIISVACVSTAGCTTPVNVTVNTGLHGATVIPNVPVVTKTAVNVSGQAIGLGLRITGKIINFVLDDLIFAGIKGAIKSSSQPAKNKKLKSQKKRENPLISYK